MTYDDFVGRLQAEGFSTVVTVEREAGGGLDAHTHPFEAWALVLDGDIVISTNNTECRYAAGETFRLGANQLHTERYGPQGVRYLVGRK